MEIVLLQGMIDSVWCDQLSRIVLDCAGAEEDEHDRLIRRLAYCLSSAPTLLHDHIVPSITESELDALLQFEAFESAVFRLLDGNFNVLVSKHCSGDAMATLGMPGLVEEVSIYSATVTRALIGACAAALISWAKIFDDNAEISSLN